MSSEVASRPTSDVFAPSGTAALHREWVAGSEQLSGATLVIVNTVIGDSRTWREIYKPFAAKHRVLLIDVTNQGRSPSLATTIAVKQQTEEICAVVAAEGIDEPVWVGNSSSTSFACHLAANSPTAKLILLSPLLSLGMERRIDFMKQTFSAALEDASLETFHRQLTLLTCGSRWLEANRFAPAAMLLRLRSLFTMERLRVSWHQTFFPERDRIETLRSIRCPILLLRGAEEMLQPAALLSSIFADNNFSLETLDCGHNLLEESAPSVFARLRAFLQSPQGNSYVRSS